MAAVTGLKQMSQKVSSESAEYSLEERKGSGFEKTQKVFKSHGPLLARISLTDPKVLESYLDRKFKKFQGVALAIARSIYKTAPRIIRGTNCGRAFSMDPEILAYSMQIAKGKTVLEIAGAGGENAALLAFSGAEKVYMNEFSAREMESFCSLRKELPQEVQERLEPIQGSCFDILDKNPRLQQKVGLVLCRNLIHFFNDQEQAEFFQKVKGFLRPDGRAIFTVNPKDLNTPVFKENSDCTSFYQTLCLITDRNVSASPQSCIYQALTPCSGELVSSKFDEKRIYNRDKGKPWVVDNMAFNRISSEHRTKIRTAMQENKGEVQKIKNGSVRVLTTCIRLYSKENLAELFKKHGFEVEFTFAVGQDGHLIHEEGLLEEERQVGVIVTLDS